MHGSPTLHPPLTSTSAVLDSAASALKFHVQCFGQQSNSEFWYLLLRSGGTINFKLFILRNNLILAFIRTTGCCCLVCFFYSLLFDHFLRLAFAFRLRFRRYLFSRDRRFRGVRTICNIFKL